MAYANGYKALTRYGARSSPSAMVLRSVRGALMNRYGSRAGVAARVIGTAWRNRKAIGAVTRRLALRRWRSAVPTRLGRRMVPDSNRVKSKAASTAYATTSRVTLVQTLDWQALVYPDRSVDGNDMTNNIRLSQQIRLKGFKICRTFASNYANNDPIIVHWALMQDKDNDRPTDAIANSLKRQFFRVHNDVQKKHLAFTDTNAFWSHHYNCAPINPDGDWKILTHLKFRIDPKDKGVPSTNWIKTHERFYPVRKWAHFNNVDTQANLPSNIPDHPIYEVWWFSAMEPPGHNAGGSIRTHANNICYFSNKV